MKKHKNKIIFGVVAAALLALAFWWGGDAPGLKGFEPQAAVTENEAVRQTADAPSTAPAEESETTAVPEQNDSQPATENTKKPEAVTDVKKPGEPATPENKPVGENGAALTAEEKVALAEEMTGTDMQEDTASGNEAYSKEQGMEIDRSTGQDPYGTYAVPEGQPVPVEPQNAEITDKELTCTLSVRCDTILDNMAWMDPEKIELVPEDGVIFPEQTVTFYEGESVFNLLLREMKKNKIHFEFQNVPFYNSAYIEGTQNIYEFDCGELSGWRYKVNDWFPNFGCSRYQLKQGDRVEWVYTCDLGADVGASYGQLGE